MNEHEPQNLEELEQEIEHRKQRLQKFDDTFSAIQKVKLVVSVISALILIAMLIYFFVLNNPF